MYMYQSLTEQTTTMWIYWTLLLGLLHLTWGQVDMWRLQTNTMPSDSRLVPAVGNGHVATQVYSDTMYVNNVYSGYTNTSHRARVPSTVAVRAVLEDTLTELYSLELDNGLFRGQFETSSYIMDQRIYAHRTRTRLLVNEITVTRQDGVTGDVTVALGLNLGEESEDFNLATVDFDAETFYTSGAITEPETDTSTVPTIHQYWTRVPASVVLPSGETSMTWRHLTAISIDQQDALAAYDDGRAASGQQLLNEHTDAWQAIWQSGDIKISDDNGGTDLGQTIRAAMFHILISTPDQPDSINPFGGLSPGGLARGGQINNLTSAYNDYLGHVFWDMDTWILPAVLMFHPHMAQIMISSRSRVIDAARDLASEGGYQGIRFPWEQAYTGYETCPWDLAALYQIHVTADVSYSVRQYLYSTEDDSFVTSQGGRELAMEIARFWASRVVLLDADKGYEIHGVMGPDENSANVNNSVFTNYNAVLSLSLPQYLADKLNIVFDATELAEIEVFNDIAANMYQPFNEELQFHPQYDGFDYLNSTIKQSDVVLLGYPLMQEMSTEVRRNDLELYETLLDKYGPDTGTWSMHTVGWLELGNASKAADMFPYMERNINGPFKIFSEKPSFGPDGMRATNFITLAGGMLQAMIFGYGGVRVRERQMELNPTLPPNSTNFVMTGFKYRGSTLTLDFIADDITVTLTDQQPGAEGLVLLTSSQRVELVHDVPVVVPSGPVTIVTLSDEPPVQLSSR